jgi:hypothetical protein
MAMTTKQIERFEMLASGPCVSLKFVRDYYGLDWVSRPVTPLFARYAGSLARRVSCPVDRLSRYELEGFMARNDIVTRKWAGVRLGMSVESLDALLDKIESLGMQASRYVFDTDFVADSLREDLIRNMPGLRFRTFADHTSFCERLHAELRNEVGLEVERVFCNTSDRLEEYPRRFAEHIDCLSLEPLSTKHSMWLNFRKPLNLPPDRCSKLLYVENPENRELLRTFIAGTGEPDNLGDYERFVEHAQNG